MYMCCNENRRLHYHYLYTSTPWRYTVYRDLELRIIANSYQLQHLQVYL